MMLRKIYKGAHNEDFTGSTATLFVSQANLSDSRGTRLLRQESVVRNSNKAVVQKLLANFDMEKTKQKYVESKVVEIVWDSNDFSFDSALSTAKVRARLHQLMGTDVIRLNDKNYTNEMTQKLEEERKADVKRKEQALAEAEEQRLRKLQLNGILPKTKNEINPKNNNAVVKNPNNQKSSMNRSRMYTEERDNSKKNDEDEQLEREKVITQMDHMKEEKYEDDENETNEENSGTTTIRSNNKTMRDKEYEIKSEVKAKEKKGREIGESESEDKKSNQKKPKRETSFIRELKNAETVDGLYKVADRLLKARNDHSS